MLDRYADAGGNVLDTAVNYQGGGSEQVVGDLLRGRRDRFVVSTKYTMSRDSTDPNAAGGQRKNLRVSLETSLRQLRTDYIDLYWVHMWDRHTPVEETMRALDDAVRAGKILHIGLSDTPAWVVSRAHTLAQWHDWTPVSAIQVPYNVYERDVERELLPMAESLGMTVTTWSPLGHGVLSGRHTRDGRQAEELDERKRAAALAVQEVADKLGATPAQVAIAWSQGRSRSVHPIIGASRVEQLEDNLGAAGLELPPEAIERLTGAVEFSLGFPSDFIGDADPVAFAGTYDQLV